MYGFSSQDGRSDFNGASGYNISVAHAVTSWWKPEVYIGEFNREPGATTHPSGYEFENTFQLTTRGEYWADVGILASYAHNKQPGVLSSVEFGTLLEKWSGHINQRLNLILEKQVGAGASGTYALRSAYSVSYKMDFRQGFIFAWHRSSTSAPMTTPIKSAPCFTARFEQIKETSWNIASVSFMALTLGLLPRRFWPAWNTSFSNLKSKPYLPFTKPWTASNAITP